MKTAASKGIHQKPRREREDDIPVAASTAQPAAKVSSRGEGPAQDAEIEPPWGQGEGSATAAPTRAPSSQPATSTQTAPASPGDRDDDDNDDESGVQPTTGIVVTARKLDAGENRE